MVTVCFIKDGDEIAGFDFSGHAGAGGFGKDIVCAAVSSAAYMAANTITEIIGAKADISVDDGAMSLIVNAADRRRCRDILNGLMLHLDGISQQYGKNVKLVVKHL
ncbi:MAG: ribosomal-processing cysteine protease Prp [Clostridia bacterium]|nr:ribosomal-processing cysteine protease Prp [Clostridia bacterium]